MVEMEVARARDSFDVDAALGRHDQAREQVVPVVRIAEIAKRAGSYRGISTPSLDALVAAELRERYGYVTRVAIAMAIAMGLEPEVKLSESVMRLRRVSQSVMYVQQRQCPATAQAGRFMRSFAPVIFVGNSMMSEQGSVSNAPRVAPHPLLKS